MYKSDYSSIQVISRYRCLVTPYIISIGVGILSGVGILLVVVVVVCILFQIKCKPGFIESIDLYLSG